MSRGAIKFNLPQEIVDALGRAKASTGASFSKMATDALRQYLEAVPGALIPSAESTAPWDPPPRRI